MIGAVAGYLSLWLVYWGFKLRTGKEGMGYGDFKLLAAIGAWLGWKMLPLVILLSSVVGAIVGALQMSRARGMAATVPLPLRPLPRARRPDRDVLGRSMCTTTCRRCDRMALVIALTGGIGSGKSSVANMLAELGAAVIDTTQSRMS